MTTTRVRCWLAGTAVTAIVGAPRTLLACATCFGKSDSALARGMNWGIFSLMAVVVLVLGSIAGFFVYLARRAAKNSQRAGDASFGLSEHTASDPVREHAECVPAGESSEPFFEQ